MKQENLISLSNFATIEIRKLLTRIAVLSLLSLLPIFIFFKNYMYKEDLQQIYKSIWSSVSYSVSVYDTFQIERTLFKFKNEFKLASLKIIEYDSSNQIINRWGKISNPNYTFQTPAESLQAQEIEHSLALETANWTWEFSEFPPIVKLVMNERNSDNRSFRILITKTVPILPFFFELLSVLVLIFSGQVLLAYAFKQLTKKLINPIENLTFSLRSENAKNEIPKVLEIQSLYSVIKENESYVKTSLQREHEKRQMQEIIKLTDQVAHDIRSPLAVANLVLRSSSLDNDGIDMLRESFGNIKNIVEDLSSQSKSSKIDKVNISELALNVINEKRVEFSSNAFIEFKIETPPYPVFLDIDSSGLKRCISNLLNNSAEATLKTLNTISLKIIRSDEELILTITDTGKGIPENKFKNILENGISYAKPTGSGIGVKSTREFIEKFSGKISFEPNLPSGVKATIIFPSSFNLITGGTINIRPNTNVVIIDDSPLIIDSWKMKFSKLKINTSYFTNPLDALNLPLNKKYLFLCDFDMGKDNLNGLDLYKNLKKLNFTFEFILASGSNADDFTNESWLNFLPKSSLPNIHFILG